MQTFKSGLIISAAFVIIFCSNCFSMGGNPVPDPEAVVTRDNIRITVLTPGLFRLEWSANGEFENRTSLTFINRHTEVPEYSVSEKNGILEVKTAKLLLKYKTGTGKFSKENLSIDINTGGMDKTWRFGEKNGRNLKGTARTLDGYNGNVNVWSNNEIDLGKGIISRSGWCVIDDTDKPLFDNSDWQWVIPRPETEHQDYYFFGYGYDYKQAMKDFTKVAGKIPMPPKFAFGIWWSKYWNYNDNQYRNIIEQFNRYDLGLDVLVIDMDWHITSLPQFYDESGRKKQDQAGQRSGWTGFTWNKNYFPAPKQFLEWTNRKSIKTCLNLHPASGIQPHEKKYPEFAKAMGIDPNTEKYVPFDIVDKKFANNFFNIILEPMENKGVDFWWLDWQQWSTTSIPGVNPTFYLNYVFYSHMAKNREVRPMVFHRWGGLGNHRYPIGFSGDTIATWESLAYQPYFTSTAANVGFGYWSHDIGGHNYNSDHGPELYTRWIQWGVLSPIFRTHATADSRLERRPWAYPRKYFQAMRKAYDLRYTLTPYIYTASRKTYDTGISICSPLYYHYPKNPKAYSFKNEYIFGDDLLVNPVVSPIEDGKKYISQKTWLPEGKWYEYATGEIINGSAVVERPFALDEIPIYVKAGTILPTRPETRRIDEKPFDPLVLNIYPGDGGKTSIYDDQGNNQGYKNGKFTFTDVEFERGEDKTVVTIHPAKGGWKGMPDSREYRIKLLNTFPPESVTANGKRISYSEKKADKGWYYDGGNVSTVIKLGRQSVDKEIKIVIERNDADTAMLSGLKGKFKRLNDFVDYAGRIPEPRYEFEPVISTALTGRNMSYNPSEAAKLVREFDSEYSEAIDIIENKSSRHKDWLPYLEWLKAGSRSNQ